MPRPRSLPPLTPDEKQQDNHEQDVAFLLVVLLGLLAVGFVILLVGLSMTLFYNPA